MSHNFYRIQNSGFITNKKRNVRRNLERIAKNQKRDVVPFYKKSAVLGWVHGVVLPNGKKLRISQKGLDKLNERILGMLVEARDRAGSHQTLTDVEFMTIAEIIERNMK